MSCSAPLRDNSAEQGNAVRYACNVVFGTHPRIIRDFLPFFTTDEPQCHHYGGRIVAPNALLSGLSWRLRAKMIRPQRAHPAFKTGPLSQRCITLPVFHVPSVRRDTVLGNSCGDRLDRRYCFGVLPFHCRCWSGRNETSAHK